MADLLADALARDARVEQAKRLLLEALADHHRNLAGPRPPAPELEEAYARTLARFEELRGGALYFPYLGSGFGTGCLVELADGSAKYDMISGIGAHPFGHGHPALHAAALQAALEDVVMLGNLQQGRGPLRLAELLLAAGNRRGARLAHCFFTTSGAMANENALKLAFHRHHPATRLLAFNGCFLGRTLALAQITDKPGLRVGLPPTLSVDYLPFFDAGAPAASGRAALEALRRFLGRYPGQHAALCCELVLGEGGFYPGDRAFFEPLMRLARESGVAVLVDEVQTFGRTTEPFAFQHFGLDDYVDLVTVGKMTQVCATLFRAEYLPGPGLISQTFTGAAAAFAAGTAIVDGLLEGGFFGPDGKNARLHALFAEGLEAISRRRPGVLRGPYGIGSMIAFTVLDGSREATEGYVKALFREGVLAFTAGAGPTRVRFLPPAAAVEETDVSAVLDVVERTLVAAAGG